MRYLVIHDADAIQGYVFNVDKLREIRGASALIDKINRDETAALVLRFGGTLIYAGGGGAAAHFSDPPSAESFCQVVSSAYVEKTFTASSTGVVQEYDETAPPGSPNGFGSALQKAHRKLHERKAMRMRRTQLPSSPFYKLCGLCGMHPAAHFQDLPDQTERQFICQSCHAKRGQPYIHQHISQQALDQYGAWLEFTGELEEIGKAAEPEGYIGIIYADGNRMGERLQRIQTEDTLKEFSKTVNDSLRDILTDLMLRRYCTPEGRQIPLTVPLCGGDDLVLILPAQDAFEFTLDFLEGFQEEVVRRLPEDAARELGPEGEVSACAGIAIAKSHTPLAGLLDLAHDLCSLAKGRSYKLFRGEEPQETPCIDFQVVTTSSWGSPAGTRKEQFRLDDRTRLTARPYTVAEARGLLMAARGLKAEDFPPGKLNAFYRSFWEGRHRAAFHYHTMYLRARESVQGPHQKRALMDAQAHLGLGLDAPWQDWPGRSLFHQTPYPDLVELYPFVS